MANPPGKMPGTTAGRMPPATEQSGGGNEMRTRPLLDAVRGGRIGWCALLELSGSVEIQSGEGIDTVFLKCSSLLPISLLSERQLAASNSQQGQWRMP
jgi:hypothetical protein